MKEFQSQRGLEGLESSGFRRGRRWSFYCAGGGTGGVPKDGSRLKKRAHMDKPSAPNFVNVMGDGRKTFL
jgi:hypothetical protein